MVRQEESVDQIVFRWDADNASGTTGFGPVAWSCGQEHADVVFRSVASLLRATGEDTAPALVRLERDNSALLLHRTPWRDASGHTQTICHALLGSSQTLDPETCLGLHTWRWEGSQLPLDEVRGPLGKVPAATLIGSAMEGQRRLAESVADVEEELTGLVAEYLRHPRHRFTVLDRQGGDSACRVLWGMAGIFGGLIGRGWTFATHDTSETTLLRFVFVRSWPGAAAQDTQRLRTDPLELRRDRAQQLASGLVRHHVQAQAEGREFEVDRELRQAAASRRAGSGGGRETLLDTVERALSALESAGRARARRAEEHRPPPWEAPVPSAREPYSEREPDAGRPDPYSGREPRTTHQRPPVLQPRPVAQPVSHPSPLTVPQPPAPAGPAAEPEVRIVRPEWPVPQGSPRRLVPRPRRRGPTVDHQELLTVLAAFPDRYNGPATQARTVVRGATDEDLLHMLRASIHYEALTLVIAELAHRWPHWQRSRRRHLCDTLLDLDLFLTETHGLGIGGPGDEIRAANAAALYSWAIRPQLNDPETIRRLAELLPRLSTGPHRAGRGAAWQIVSGERPGLPETVWFSLLRAAHGQREPDRGVTGAARVVPQVLPDRAAGDQAPPPSAAPRDPDRSAAQDGRMIVVALAGVLVVAVALLVMLTSVM
ncbi:hypothetical protein FBY35_1715 [Streptomyces sp. SLBN-118]|uniref:hypothetical protein n=1 Tax=Streptomyces sp. SLBN-118 TaxID=2768454 RepID=UPI00115480D0|nr:hypothetical protein [Streptomyces sp. SLBN-118]TQK51318.1 hypothetical protein FBY35_1715 [Streptomyces sp. SLBN-118]